MQQQRIKQQLRSNNVMRSQVYVRGAIYNGLEHGSTNQNQGTELSVLQLKLSLLQQ